MSCFTRRWNLWFLIAKRGTGSMGWYSSPTQPMKRISIDSSSGFRKECSRETAPSPLTISGTWSSCTRRCLTILRGPRSKLITMRTTQKRHWKRLRPFWTHFDVQGALKWREYAPVFFPHIFLFFSDVLCCHSAWDTGKYCQLFGHNFSACFYSSGPAC